MKRQGMVAPRGDPFGGAPVRRAGEMHQRSEVGFSCGVFGYYERAERARCRRSIGTVKHPQASTGVGLRRRRAREGCDMRDQRGRDVPRDPGRVAEADARA